MKTSIHVGCAPAADVETDIRNARAAGFDATELSIPKLERYFEQDPQAADRLPDSLGDLAVSMVDVLMPVERIARGHHHELLDAGDRWARLAQRVGCPALQVVVLNEFDVTTWREQRDIIVASLRRLADRTFPHGVRLGIEPVCFSQFSSLDQALEVIDLVGRERAGIVLDTWHLWVGETSWPEVAALDARDIVTVQIADSGPRKGDAWADDDRDELPGRGLVPLAEGIDAILRTGYAGYWSAELFGRRHAEREPAELFRDVQRHLVACLDRASRGIADGYETRTER